MNISTFAMLQKRAISLFAAVCVVFPLFADAQPIIKPSKVVVVVLDDSGSMYENDGIKTTRWIRANYALKTLASLLDDNDSLLIFPLNGAPLGPYIGVSGLKKAIRELDQFSNNNGRTPYGQVTAALDKLIQRQEAEKWFVVITDGVFNDGFSEKLDEENRKRAFQANVQSAFLLIEQQSSTTAKNWKNDAKAEIFDAQTVEEVYPKLRDAATWLNGQANRGITLTESGNQLILDSEFPLRRLILLRQDKTAAKLQSVTVTGKTMPADTLRQHLIHPNLPVNQLTDTSIYHLTFRS